MGEHHCAPTYSSWVTICSVHFIGQYYWIIVIDERQCAFLHSVRIIFSSVHSILACYWQVIMAVYFIPYYISTYYFCICVQTNLLIINSLNTYLILEWTSLALCEKNLAWYFQRQVSVIARVWGLDYFFAEMCKVEKE